LPNRWDTTLLGRRFMVVDPLCPGNTPQAGWLRRLLDRRPTKVAAIAIASKTARIMWSVLIEERLSRKENTAAAAWTQQLPRVVRLIVI
jgi:hypothetical protein